MWKLDRNACALAGLSRMSTPRNWTPLPPNRRASDDRTGASVRQGGHQDPQKFSTTTCPRDWASASLWPARVVPVTVGAVGPELAPYSVVPAAPDTKLWPLLPAPLCPIAPLSQAATGSAAAIASAAPVAAVLARGGTLSRARARREVMP